MPGPDEVAGMVLEQRASGHQGRHARVPDGEADDATAVRQTVRDVVEVGVDLRPARQPLTCSVDMENQLPCGGVRLSLGADALVTRRPRSINVRIRREVPHRRKLSTPDECEGCQCVYQRLPVLRHICLADGEALSTLPHRGR